MKPIEVVDELNELIWGENAEHEENFEISFKYTYQGSWECIYYEEFLLWCSEMDDREWIEEIQDYEDLLKYCIKEFCKIGKQMVKLNKLLLPKSIKYDCTKCKNSFMNPFDQYFCAKEEYNCDENDCKGKEFLKE